MNMKLAIVSTLSAACLSMATIVQADDSVVGKIQMIFPYLPQGIVYVHLQGYPQLNGGSCPAAFFVGQMSDPNFKTYVYSALLTAKAANEDIKLSVSGCHSVYPLITGVEYSPRQ